MRPADRLAPTPGSGPATPTPRTVALAGRGTTGRIAAAAVAAAGDHQRRHGASLAKVGLTVAVGGPAGVGNVASYRRIDVAPTDPIGDLVQAALASPEEPGEQVSAPKLVLRPPAGGRAVLRHAADLQPRAPPGARRAADRLLPGGARRIRRVRRAVRGGGRRDLAHGAGADLSPGDARRLADGTADRLVDRP
ncbi:MAG: hypothetical protein R2702_16570 [Acidimicrobiales bacterium]